MMTLPARYVPRSAWGARPATSVTQILPSMIDGIVYHYTASGSDEQADHRNCAGRVRGIQNYHMTATPQDPTKPWSDIAYSFCVCKHGYVFEGRGLERKSAATGAANSHTLAVCFLGDDTSGRDDVTALGREALLNVTRYIRAQRPLAKKLSGHRDFMGTSCPGQEIYAYIHGDVFRRLLDFDNAKRLAALRKWILQQRAYGATWAWLKTTPNSREFIRRGGR